MKLRVASTIAKDTTLNVADSVFGAPLNEQLIAQAVHVFESNQRQGTSKTKTRSEVARTKKKWYKQKGTGGARHGARTPSIFVGGGVSHGPNGMQNWTLKMSTTMRRAALCSALSAQAAQDVAFVTDDITQLDGKTASAQKLLGKMLPTAARILIVVNKPSQLMQRSLRNLPNVIMSSSARLNTYEVACADAIVFTKEAVKALEARLATDEAAEKSVAPEVVPAATPAPVKAEKAATPAKPAVKKVAKAKAAK